MISRKKALEFLHKNMQSTNLRRHCYAVEAVMKSLARHFKEDEEKWGIAGLIHDADYEISKEHPKIVLEWLKDKSEKKIYDAVASHAWKYVDFAPEPKTKMDWSLYCCDDLTGLIVAVALVRPDRKLSSVTVESILKKWNQKSFAAGVDRKQIGLCEEKLKIPLREFIDIALEAMQKISDDLGL